MTKRAVVLQYQEHNPWNPGWWRYSRPVLRHLKEEELPPICREVRFWYPTRRAMASAAEAQRDWDRKYPKG